VDFQVHEVADPPERRGIADAVLRALPAWFGIESAIVDYVHQVAKTEDMWFWSAVVASRPVGFLSLRRHNPYTSEIYCMGVLQEFHHRGIGTALVRAAEQHATDLGVEFLTVKTLDVSRPDTAYAKTRQFYRAMGFKPLEVLASLWGDENPCLFLVKTLGVRSCARTTQANPVSQTPL
jgi:ribosomal protein S18 acetylase RimI-like enzyme